MKRIICGLLFLLLFVSSTQGQPQEKGKNELLLNGLGFAFQGKEFKTVRLSLISEKPAKSTGSEASAQPQIQGQGQPQGQNQQQQLKGKIVIGGYTYILKVTLFETVTIEADVFSEDSRPGAPADADAKNEKKLAVPIGHVSLKLSEPEPGNPVILGSLQLKDEKVTAVTGEFELYLNDITKKQKPKDKQ